MWADWLNLTGLYQAGIPQPPIGVDRMTAMAAALVIAIASLRLAWAGIAAGSGGRAGRWGWDIGGPVIVRAGGALALLSLWSQATGLVYGVAALVVSLLGGGESVVGALRLFAELDARLLIEVLPNEAPSPARSPPITTGVTWLPDAWNRWIGAVSAAFDAWPSFKALTIKLTLLGLWLLGSLMTGLVAVTLLVPALIMAVIAWLGPLFIAAAVGNVSFTQGLLTGLLRTAAAAVLAPGVAVVIVQLLRPLIEAALGAPAPAAWGEAAISVDVVIRGAEIASLQLLLGLAMLSALGIASGLVFGRMPRVADAWSVFVTVLSLGLKRLASLVRR
jgi:hypothetical protein